MLSHFLTLSSYRLTSFSSFLTSHVFDSSILQRLSIQAQDSSSHQHHSHQQLTKDLARHEALLTLLCEKFEESSSTPKELARTLENFRQASPEVNETRLAPLGPPMALYESTDAGPRIKSGTELRMQSLRPINTYRQQCHCFCSRSRWMLVSGSGSLQFRGLHVPFWKSKCNMQYCNSWFIRINYCLPIWVARRMISLWFSSSPLYGPELLLRVPRVISNSSLIIKSIDESNLEWFKLLVAQGEGSPYDVDESGSSFYTVRACTL